MLRADKGRKMANLYSTFFLAQSRDAALRSSPNLAKRLTDLVAKCCSCSTDVLSCGRAFDVQQSNGLPVGTRPSGLRLPVV
mmetsp:Transcript_10151/g.16641  ORF Transcript_10151/g.16641 Transcript_10151/m.16641 type:complete len:81 (-) Transcript_10151:843-1085(-)